jgi:outer membrane protein, heavy metal efflux system
MRMYVLMALALAATAWAQAPSNPPSLSPPVANSADPVLASLLREALDRSPDLARSADLIAAEREKVPQARALPDPTLSLGIQNDGFQGIQVGKMENSFYQVMLTQPFYWPGKRGLKADVASLGAQVSEANLSRDRLTLRADVKRAYYGLLLVREQRRLLDLQTPLLQQAEAIAKTRYEVGQGAQADLLRAQLALTRLAQTRLTLESEEATALANLNRLRAMPPETPIPTTQGFGTLPDPTPIRTEAAMDPALAESPELNSARVGLKQAERSLDLARLNRRPDFTVSAGIMPRGSLDPMWTFNVGITLPLWSKNKQQRAVAEQEFRREAQGSQVEGLSHLVKERIHERSVRLDSSLEMLRLYREGLLVQSEGAFKASLAQYETGKAPFTSVLESLNGWIADQSGLLQTQAQAQAIAIAQEELTLGVTLPIGATALSASPMGSGGFASSAGARKPGATSSASGDGNSSSMTSM